MKNPFNPTKFEWEDDPQIWLSPQAKSLTQSKKPAYISGTRGSGKTTMLRSLSSKLLLESDFLRNQFSGSGFTWFGVYLQFNRNLQFYTAELSQLINSASHDDQPIIEEYEIFSKYFEVSLLSSFLEEVKLLELNGTVHTKASSERDACKELEAIFVGCDIPGVKAINDYSDARRLCEKILDIFLARDYDYAPSYVRRIISTFRTGRLIRLIKNYGVPSLSSRHFKANRVIDLYIMVDDCESLTTDQQKALNTYIRLTEGEAKWIVSYLSGQFNSTDTYLPNTSLTEADRDIKKLNDMSDSDFSIFCEKVADIRLKKFISTNTQKKLSDTTQFTFKKFGDYSYNYLCEASLEGSQSRPVRDFKNRVNVTKRNLTAVLPKKFHKSFHCDGGQMPYIEHVIIEELRLDIGAYVMQGDEQTLLKVIARKQVAAFVYTCKRLNRSPMYFGKSVATAFSDTTIRDFLDLMSEMFQTASDDRASENTLARRSRSFLDTGDSISPRQQHSAIKRASYAKYLSIEALASSTEPHIANMVNAVGYITSELHGVENGAEALRIPERGIFRVDVSAVNNLLKDTSDLGDFLRIARRMERDGFIKIVEMPSNSVPCIRFRLHKRLCPHFECSPRSGYENVNLPGHDVTTILTWDPTRDIKSWCKGWVRKQDAQGELLFGREE